MNYTLGKQDLLKIGKGLLIALGGAALTYVAQVYPHVNFGMWTPIAVALLSVLINAGWKVLDGQKA
jgi:hypothetical protein